ncbi:MAG: Gfo/Idh/MocA family protein [Acidimicrobiales bacterium]
MEETRVGIIGTGWMAEAHRGVLDGLEGVAIVAVADLDLGKGEAFASRCGARAYGDWRQLLDEEDLDAVFVCVPPLAHKEPALAAFARGLPTYLEKPIARDLDDAALVVQAAEAAGCVCAVGYQWHALPLLSDLRGLLAGQAIGLLVGTSIGPTASRPWFLDRRAGGGNLLERGSHHLDLLRSVGGEIASVQAAASRVLLARGAGDPGAVGGGDIDDAVSILAELRSGALASVTVAWTREDQPGRYALDVVAAEATLRLDLDPDFRLSGTSSGNPVSIESPSLPLEASVTAFLRAAKAGDPALVCCTPKDARATLEVAVAAERALATGRAVDVAIV